MQERAKELNFILKDLCKLHNFIFIDNHEITTEYLVDGVHLNDIGSNILAENFLYYLNG